MLFVLCKRRTVAILTPEKPALHQINLFKKIQSPLLFSSQQYYLALVPYQTWNIPTSRPCREQTLQFAMLVSKAYKTILHSYVIICTDFK